MKNNTTVIWIATLLLSPSAFAGIDDVITLREGVEILATETEELKATLKQEESVYSSKYQDLKNQVLREKLKRIQLEQQIAQFQQQRKNKTPGKSELTTSQAEQMNRQFQKGFQSLKDRVSSASTWKQDLTQLDELLAEGQYNLYQSKLIQFLERRLQESTQVKKNFQSLPMAEGKTFEVLNLGYLISFAKNQESAYFFSAGKGWVALTSDSQRTGLEKIFADHKARNLQFIPLSLFPNLEEKKDKSYVGR